MPNTMWKTALRHVAMMGVCIVLSGCFGRVELNQLAVVDLLGVDLTPDRDVLVSAQFVIPGRLGAPSGGGGGGGRAPQGASPFYVMQASGATLPEALSLLQAKVPRRLFTSHIRVIVLGEEFARAGVAPLFDTVARVRELRLSHEVIVTRGEAVDLLHTATLLERLPGSALVGLLNENIVPTVTVRELLLALSGEGIDPFLPLVRVAPSVGSETGGPPPPSGETAAPIPGEFEVSGVGVFQGDRLVGFVPRREARGLAWLRNEVERLTATFTWPVEQRVTERSGQSATEEEILRERPPARGGAGPGSGLRNPTKISSRVLRASTQVKPEISGDTVTIKLKVRSEDHILTNQAGIDLSDPDVIPQVEKLLAEDVERRMRTMLHWAQDVYQADVFGFGAAVHRGHPKAWRKLKENWHAVFSRLEVDIEVEAKVRRVGFTKEPTSFKKDQIRR